MPAGCAVSTLFGAGFQLAVSLAYRESRPQRLLLRSWPTGSMALWVMVMLLAYLLFYYLG